MWAINKELSDVASSFLKRSSNPHSSSKSPSNVDGSFVDSRRVSTKGTITGNAVGSRKTSFTTSTKESITENNGEYAVDSKRDYAAITGKNSYSLSPNTGVSDSVVDGSKRFSTITGTNRATVFEVDQANPGEDNEIQSQSQEQGLDSQQQQQQELDFDQQSTIIDSSSSTTPPANSFGESSASYPEPNQKTDPSSSTSKSEAGNINLDKEILPVETNSYEPRINQKDSESEYRAVTPVSILKQQEDSKAPALRNLTDILKVFAKSEDNNKPPIIDSGSNDLTKILKVYGKDHEAFPPVNRKKVIDDTPKKFIASAPKPKHREPAIQVEYPRPKFLEFRTPSKTKDVESTQSHGLLKNDHQQTILSDGYDDKAPVTRENMQQDNNNNDEETDLHYDDLDEPPVQSKTDERFASSRQLFDKKPKDKPIKDHMKAIGAAMEQNNKIADLIKQNGMGNVDGLEPNKLPNHIIETNERMMKLSENLFSNGKKSGPKENIIYPSLPYQEIIDSQRGANFVGRNGELMRQTDLSKSRDSLATQPEETVLQTTTAARNQYLGEDPFLTEASATTNGKFESNENQNDMFNSYSKLKKQQDGRQFPLQQQQQKASFQQNIPQQQQQQQEATRLPQQQQQPSKLAFLKKIPAGRPKGPSIAVFDSIFQTSRSEVKTKTKATATGNAVAQSTSKADTDINGQKDSSYSKKIDGMKEQLAPLARHDPPRRQGSRNSYGTGHGQGYGYGKTSYGRGGGHAWAGDNYNNYQVPHFGLPDNEDSNNQNKQQPTQGQSGTSGESQASQQTPVNGGDVPNQDSASSAPIASPQPGNVASQTTGQEASSPVVPQYTNKKLNPLAQKLPVKQVKETSYKPPTKAESNKLNVEDDQENGEEEENDEDENERLLNNKEAAPEHGKKVEQKIQNKLERPKGSKFSETATGSGYGTGYGNKESWGQGGGYAWAGKAPPNGAPNPADFMQKPAGMPDFPQVSGQTKGI